MAITVNIKRINIDGADYISGQLIPFKNGNKVSFRNTYRYDFVAYNIPVTNIINEVTGVCFVDINEFNTFFEANFTKANGGGNPVSLLLTSYVKATTSRAITALDSVLVAIGILEKKADDNNTSLSNKVNGNTNVLLSNTVSPISWNFSLGNTASLLLNGNKPLTITNNIAYTFGVLVIKQDSTGSRILNLPTGSKKETGFALSTTANATDLIAFFYDGVNYFWTISKNFIADLSPDVIWANLVNTSFSGTRLTKTGGAAFAAGATATKKISLIGTGEQGRFTIITDIAVVAVVIGLSNVNPDAGYTSIQYGFYWDNASNYTIYESGTSKQTGTIISGTTKFDIVAFDNSVKYYKNDVLIYTSATAPTFPLLLDVSMNADASYLDNAKLTGNLIDV